MTTETAPMPDSETNTWLEPLKTSGYDEIEIDAALTGLLADPVGRASLVQHLADFAVLATDPSLADAQRGRWLRQHFASVRRDGTGKSRRTAKRAGHADTAIGPNIVDDNSIERGGVGGWNR
jgi:hypothetical protein